LANLAKQSDDLGLSLVRFQ